MRPTSPHLTIYKKQISSVLSILHRLSGMALFGAVSLLLWWFVALVATNYAPYLMAIGSCKMVKIALMLSSAAICYHLCTGIRHLFWDMGYGFSVPVMNNTGWLAVISACCLFIIFWFVIL
jgi:succinate dehydrogenase / fumarate reductase cytochrome b subunit